VVGAAIGLRGWSSATNMIVGVTVWLTTTVLAPAAIHAIATTRHQMPARLSMLERTRELDSQVRTQAPRLLDAYYAQRPADRPPQLDVTVYDFALHWTIIQREVDRQMTPVLAAFDQALRAQQQLIARMAWLSPPLLLQELLTDLAGTGAWRQLDFLRQIGAFHDAHRAFFDSRTLRRELLTVADYERLPIFSFVDEPFSATAYRAAILVVALGLWAVVTCWWVVSR
jgi:ABC-2 type transport system permease protein